MDVEKKRLVKEITEMAHKLGSTVDPAIKNLSITHLQILKVRLGVK
jgi:hypothetical protein